MFKKMNLAAVAIMMASAFVLTSCSSEDDFMLVDDTPTMYEVTPNQKTNQEQKKSDGELLQHDMEGRDIY